MTMGVSKKQGAVVLVMFLLVIGSVLGTDYYLRLLHGYTVGAVNGSGIKIIQLTVNDNSTGPDLSSEPSTYGVLYWNSGYFYSGNETYMSTVIPITLYP